MPVQPTFLERLLLLRLNRGPGPVLDLFGAGAFEAVMVADDLGLLEALGDGSRTAGELAAEVGADAGAVGVLLEFLAACGYVAADGDRYRATAMTRRWLSPARETDLRPWFRFWRELVFPFWAEHLERAVREGEPGMTLYEYCDAEPSRWELAQRGFRAAAGLLVEDVLAKVRVPGDARRLLDVGGGHGLYAIELCRRHGLSATVFDAPAALSVADEEVAAAGLGDRIELRGGDYLADDLGEGYDLALVFNVVHAHDAAANRTLFDRVADALDPGGHVVVLDQFAGTTRLPVARAGVRFAALTYLATLGGRVHSYEAIAGWLREAGFRNPRRRSLWRVPGVSLIQATRG